ncbi:MAG: CPBP family intramembrane glutamic endopeptidase [Thermoleophilia bacterium]
MDDDSLTDNNAKSGDSAVNDPGMDGMPEAVIPEPPKKQGMPRVPWSMPDVFAIIGLVIVFGLAIFTVFGAVAGVVYYTISGSDPENLFADSPLVNSFMWFVQWAVMLGVAFTYMKIRGYHLSLNVLGFRRTRLWTAIWLTVVVRILAGIAEWIYTNFVTPEQTSVTDMFGLSLASYILTMMLVAVLTPVVEEMFFRGIIHQGLEQRLGFFPGAIISSFIFALAHIDPTLYIPIFILGFGFAYLMHKTKSLWPGIAGHFLVNALAVTVQFLDPGGG